MKCIFWNVDHVTSFESGLGTCSYLDTAIFIRRSFAKNKYSLSFGYKKKLPFFMIMKFSSSPTLECYMVYFLIFNMYFLGYVS